MRLGDILLGSSIQWSNGAFNGALVDIQLNKCTQKGNQIEPIPGSHVAWSLGNWSCNSAQGVLSEGRFQKTAPITNLAAGNYLDTS